MLKKFPIGEVVTISAIVIVILLTMRLASDNKKLSEDNGKLSQQISELGNKNDSLASTLTSLSEQIGAMNKIVADESRRRAAAEMKSQRLQDEVKDALKGNQCSLELIPADAVIGVRRAADSARGHKSTAPANSGKPAD